MLFPIILTDGKVNAKKKKRMEMQQMKITEESSQEGNEGKEERKPEDDTLKEGACEKCFLYHFKHAHYV